jgi:transcriptional regulator with AAA-type ATPase domain
LEGVDGGTLLLDDISELPVEIQGNLLRFLQEKTVQRLGSPLAAQHLPRGERARHGARDPASYAGALSC